MVICHKFKNPKKQIAAFGLLLCLLLFAGCGTVSTQKNFYDPITAELQNGNFDAAVTGIESAQENNKFQEKDRFIYYLDAGLAYHYASLYDSSNIRLSKAELAAEELFTKSISKAALSLLLNDNVLDYSGEDYEILYTNLIMALNYISEDKFDDAFVEIRRANDKLNLLEQKYRDAAAQYNDNLPDDTGRIEINYEADKVRFNNDAFARYLSMHMYAADGLMDDARIDYEWLEKAFIEQPHIYGFPMPSVKYYSPDKSIISVVALAGLSPVKEALDLRLRTDKQLDLVQILYTDPERRNTEYGHIPMPIGEDFYFKFSIPQIVSRLSAIAQIMVYLDTVLMGELQLIEDVGAVASETFNAKKSLIYLRTVARAITKGLAAYKMKKKADTGGAGGWLKKLAIDVGTDISENADLRCSRLLPGKIYVGDFEIEPGTYNVIIEFLDDEGQLIGTTTITDYKVLENGLNMIEAVSLN